MGSVLFAIFSSAYLLQLPPSWTKYRPKLPYKYILYKYINTCGKGIYIFIYINTCEKICKCIWKSCSATHHYCWREVQYSCSRQCKGYWSWLLNTALWLFHMMAADSRWWKTPSLHCRNVIFTCVWTCTAVAPTNNLLSVTQVCYNQECLKMK